MIFPPSHQAARVVEPGEETLDLPAPFRASERPAILGAAAVLAVGGDHFNAVGRHQLLVEPVTGRKRASRVAGTRWGSYGEALATCTARGRPWRSQIAMILLPLPRRVAPTAAPCTVR